jgi:hypothetical protein
MKRGGWFIDWPSKLAGEALVGMARFYQLAISPLLGGHCRYTPSCSEYFIQSVRQRGVVIGVLGGLWRICRCHPLAKGGYDPVPAGKGWQTEAKKE